MSRKKSARIINEVKNENNSDNLEYAYKSLNRVDTWINNCDSKIAILLGFIGVEITVFITTDTVKLLLNLIKNIFEEIAVGQKLLCNISVVFLLLVGAIIFALSGVKIYCALIARIDNSKYDVSGIKKQSNLFFGSIVKKSFVNLKESVRDSNEKDQMNDVLSQIYISSLIAEIKFQNYNSGLKWTIIGNIYSLVLYVLVNIVY